MESWNQLLTQLEGIQSDAKFKTVERTTSRASMEQVLALLREMLKELVDKRLSAPRPWEHAAKQGSWTVRGPL